MTAAQRQQKRRKKLQDQATGNFMPTLLDEAKAELAAQAEPNLETVISNERFMGKLSQGDLAKL